MYLCALLLYHWKKNLFSLSIFASFENMDLFKKEQKDEDLFLEKCSSLCKESML